MIESPDMTTKGIVFKFLACKAFGHMKLTSTESRPSDLRASQTMNKQFHSIKI